MIHFLRSVFIILQDFFHPLHVHEHEQLSVDIFGFPLAIFTKVSKFIQKLNHSSNQKRHLSWEV